MDFDGLRRWHGCFELLAQRYPAGMPPAEVADIVTAVASAVDYAHNQGLLHRDVKPANIMLTHIDDHGDKRILLADFGIARNLEDVSGLTATNMTVGTVAYAAPEQLTGEDIDGRADQYALAATAYHLLTGSPLFPHSNPAVVISRHLNSAPPALANKHPPLAGLDPVLAAALAKNPDDRFARCSDFASAFAEQARSNAPSTAAPTAPAVPAGSSNGISPTARRQSSSSPPSTTVPHVPSTSRWLVPVAIVAVVAALGGVALAWHPWSQRPSSAASTTQSAVPLGPTTTSPAAPPPPAPPPPPSVFPASGVDTVLLSPAEVNDIAGTSEVVTSEGRGLLKVADTTYGMSDNSEIVTPPACVGLLIRRGVFSVGR